MLMTDVMLIEKCIEDCGNKPGTVKAWNRIKKENEELAQQTHNSQSVSLVGCDRCDNIADHHFCDECLESYEH